MRTVLGALLLILCVTTAAQADPVSLIYTGNAYTSVYAEGTPSVTYTTEDFLRGFLWFRDPLAANLNGAYVDPLNFMFMDGVIGIGGANDDITSFRFWTDAEGQIVQWSIEMMAFHNSPTTGFRRTVQTINVHNFAADVSTFVMCAEGDVCLDDTAHLVTDPLYAIAALSYGAPGSWYYKEGWVGTWEPPPAPVPEPATILLLGTGLAMGGLRRRLTHRGNRERDHRPACLGPGTVSLG